MKTDSTAKNPESAELLVSCPCCGIPNYSPHGLRAHCCRAKPGRARLTAEEIAAAIAAAGGESSPDRSG